MATTNEVAKILKWLLSQQLLNKPQEEWNDDKGLLVSTYHQVLEDLEAAFLELVSRTWVNREKWFPGPSDLRTLGVDMMFAMSGVPNSAVAWREVVRMRDIQWAYPRHRRGVPKFSNPVIRTVVDWMTWDVFVNSPEEETKWLERRFSKLYDEHLETLRVMAVMPGEARRLIIMGQGRPGLFISDVFSGYLLNRGKNE